MNPILYILLVVAVSAVLAGLGWIWAGDVLALNKESHSADLTLTDDIFTYHDEEVEVTRDGVTQTVTRTVSQANMDYVADQLKENGLIEYKALFKLFAAFSHASSKLAPGTYNLNTDMDYNALINSMSARSGSRKTVSVTIPEGYTLDQIFSLLAQEGVANVSTLQKVAAEYDFKYSFLKGVLPLGDYHRLEGYLFPDTYEFYMGGGEDEAVQVLNKMILRFDLQFTDELRSQCAEMGYSIHDIVTIASLIEKETDGTDQAHIASVIYNRLDHPEYETVGLLQIDAAIAYVTGRAVTQADYQSVDSPYNTYLNKGLPPGPISSPGMVALNSALNPDDTDDYYYVLGDDGRHHYARTSAEFDRLKASFNNG
ncbi:endolytic transglycosylase MltG [Vermiculatibacterium agrestimuris]|uniref:endolytic transglycosylase MltG n=1 Tax=Vermiculatibacterium agrestimuris TaxID=2941519 RepID=UPI00203B3900|nr:endolytic transglycosylase MltG [Vermiculatibacterium agrestimuris]